MTQLIRTDRAPLPQLSRAGLVASPLVDLDAAAPPNSALYFALDMSGSMRYDAAGDDVWDATPEKTRWWAQLTAVANLLRDTRSRVVAGAEREPLVTVDGADFLTTVDGQVMHTVEVAPQETNDLRVQLYPYDVSPDPNGPDPDREGLTIYGATPADYDAAIAYLEALRVVAPRGGTPFDEAVDGAPSFFAGSDAATDVIFMFSDGAPNPSDSVDDAETILATIPAAEVRAYRIINTRINELQRLDNTPDDGVPLLDNLSATSWGRWTALLAPPEYLVPSDQVRPDRTYKSVAIITGGAVSNTTGSPVTVDLRIKAADDYYTLVRNATIPAGATVDLSALIDGLMLESGEVLQFGAAIGDAASVSISYVLTTQEMLNGG